MWEIQIMAELRDKMLRLPFLLYYSSFHIDHDFIRLQIQHNSHFTENNSMVWNDMRGELLL